MFRHYITCSYTHSHSRTHSHSERLHGDTIRKCGNQVLIWKNVMCNVYIETHWLYHFIVILLMVSGMNDEEVCDISCNHLVVGSSGFNANNAN